MNSLLNKAYAAIEEDSAVLTVSSRIPGVCERCGEEPVTFVISASQVGRAPFLVFIGPECTASFHDLAPIEAGIAKA